MRCQVTHRFAHVLRSRRAVETDDVDAKRFEPYYYRGLALIQSGKQKQAKPDLEKVLELAPNSDEAKEVQQYLKSIK